MVFFNKKVIPLLLGLLASSFTLALYADADANPPKNTSDSATKEQSSPILESTFAGFYRPRPEGETSHYNFVHNFDTGITFEVKRVEFYQDGKINIEINLFNPIRPIQQAEIYVYDTDQTILENRKQDEVAQYLISSPMTANDNGSFSYTINQGPQRDQAGSWYNWDGHSLGPLQLGDAIDLSFTIKDKSSDDPYFTPVFRFRIGEEGLTQINTDPQANSGGQTSNLILGDTYRNFSQPAPNLDYKTLTTFFIGKALFDKGHDDPITHELLIEPGPLFNGVSCSDCHKHDGRAPPIPENTPSSSAQAGMFLQLSVLDGEGPELIPHPYYGGQLSDKAVAGVPAGGFFTVQYELVEYLNKDDKYELANPHYYFHNMTYGLPGTNASSGTPLAETGVEFTDESMVGQVCYLDFAHVFIKTNDPEVTAMSIQIDNADYPLVPYFPNQFMVKLDQESLNKIKPGDNLQFNLMSVKEDGSTQQSGNYTVTIANGCDWNEKYGPAISPYDGEVFVSPRIAPQLVGMGLIDTIDDETIIAHMEQQQAADGNIKGEISWVIGENGEEAIGRYGWKAATDTVRLQTAVASHNDMGIATTLFPMSNCPSPVAGEPLVGKECRNTPFQTLADSGLDAITLYTQTLGVPMRQNIDDPQVERGQDLFNEIGCAQCHIPEVTTGTGHRVNGFSSDIPAGLQNQTIYPYTDLLLHDMGEGLADHRPSYNASGSQWRTAPLWGIGLFAVTNNHTRYLHDGRARNLLEAILWHGGEAEDAKQAVLQMDEADRKALIAFLESL